MDNYDQQPPSQSNIVSSSFGSSSNGHSKKKLLAVILGLIVVIVIVAVVIMLLPSGSSKESEGTAAEISRSVAEVTITPTGLEPSSIKVKLNQQVTITADDPQPHQLTADQDALPGFDSSQVLNKGDTYTYTFDKKGTFHYYDPADPKGFTGTVIVE